MLRCATSSRSFHQCLAVNGCRNYAAQVQKRLDVSERNTPPQPMIFATHPVADPYISLAPELSSLRRNLSGILGSAHPSLKDLAEHYFADSRNLFRSSAILLFARATNSTSPGWTHAVLDAQREDKEELDLALSCPDVLHYWNPNMPDHAESFDTVFTLRNPPLPLQPRINPHLCPTTNGLLPSQFRLAQIMEMIHVASVLHDQITPNPADTANKLSILGGDFLLGRACAALSRLGSDCVVELIASVISNLSEGRVVASPSWDDFIKNMYLKEGSLVAKGARSAVVLAGGTSAMQDIAYTFGRNFGMAMQLVEEASRGDERCWEAAHVYARRALQVIHCVPDSVHRQSLELFVDTLLDPARKWISVES
ncbi:terpenoid synthase [Cylindrobasidium torrendii FP15055 ss-10]|uniref:Terpenoid synthase n=1 Tax=Cylindrobasidium torrendii FP15055 ss-10 TaxID=1314674 RepID=A0A0D7BFJ2_9AGAR|nr:terpenoid synthase [Cylindrobasidium torrendii FP15055 ss-10]